MMKKSVMSKQQIRFMLQKGYLSAKGRNVALDVLKGKHDTTRRRKK